MAKLTKERQCHYSLDFRYEVGDNHFNISDFNSTYHYGFDFGEYVISTKGALEISKLITKEEKEFYESNQWEHPEVASDRNKWYNSYLQEHIAKGLILATPFTPSKLQLGIQWHYEQRNYDSWLQKLLDHAVLKTEEYAAAELAFSKWVGTRPGVKKAFDAFKLDLEKADPLERFGSRDLELIKLFKKNPNLTLECMALLCDNRDYRRILEHLRPSEIQVGELVRFRDRYKNSKKDPYKYGEYRDKDRIGIVVEMPKGNKRGPYGHGSKSININWIASGGQSILSEKYVKKIV